MPGSHTHTNWDHGGDKETRSSSGACVCRRKGSRRIYADLVLLPSLPGWDPRCKYKSWIQRREDIKTLIKFTQTLPLLYSEQIIQWDLSMFSSREIVWVLGDLKSICTSPLCATTLCWDQVISSRLERREAGEILFLASNSDFNFGDLGLELYLLLRLTSIFKAVHI